MAFVELVLADGVWETSTTTGTGTVTLSGALAGYRSFAAAVPAGKKTFYCMRDASNFEIGIGTPSGSSLTREQVISSTNANGPVNFLAGTKDVFCDLAFNLVALTYRTNVFAADQDFNGNRLVLDPSGGSDIRAPSDNLIDFYASSAQRVRIDGPNAILKVFKSDDTSAEGPEVRVYRQSASPATNDNLGVLRWTGNDSGGSEVTYAKVRADILTTTAGNYSSRLAFAVAAAGGLQEIFQIRPGMFTLNADMDLFGGGKAASNHNGVGWELNSVGYGIFTIDNGTPLILNRKTADGNLIELRRDNANVGLVSVAGGAVTYGTFTGHHWSEWAAGAERIEAEGTVVCTAEGLLTGFAHLPLVRPSMRVGEETVYGVITGRRKATDHDRATHLMVNGLGAYQVRVIGEVRRGQLLETSDIPGVAQAQSHNRVLASTIGKATQTHDGSGLVPCVLYCG